MARVEHSIDRENELGEDISVNTTESERDALDRAVLATIGMEVLIDRPKESEVIELEGVSDARETTRLTDFET